MLLGNSGSLKITQPFSGLLLSKRFYVFLRVGQTHSSFNYLMLFLFFSKFIFYVRPFHINHVRRIRPILLGLIMLVSTLQSTAPMITVNKLSKYNVTRRPHRRRTQTVQSYSPDGANVTPSNTCFLGPLQSTS